VNNFKAAQARLDVAFENGQSIAMLNRSRFQIRLPPRTPAGERSERFCGPRFAPLTAVTFRLVLGKAVAFLNLALELFLPSVDYVEVVVGKPASLLLRAALEFFPIPFDSTPVGRGGAL
jgi:hypothetical protein